MAKGSEWKYLQALFWFDHNLHNCQKKLTNNAEMFEFVLILVNTRLQIIAELTTNIINTDNGPKTIETFNLQWHESESPSKALTVHVWALSLDKRLK